MDNLHLMFYSNNVPFKTFEGCFRYNNIPDDLKFELNYRTSKAYHNPVSRIENLILSDLRKDFL